jgi:hypothetical protein
MLKMIGEGRFNGLRCNLLKPKDKTWQREGTIEQMAIHDDGKRIEFSIEVMMPEGGGLVVMRTCFEIGGITLVHFGDTETKINVSHRGDRFTALITDPRALSFTE